MQDVVIVAARRTAVGSFGGSLAGIPASDLGALVIKDIMASTGVAPAQIDEVLLGQVLTAGVGQNPARQAAIKAGLPDTVPAMTINKVCGSGLKALHLATQAIRCGDAEIVLAGGQENMSASPHILPNSRNGQRMGDWKAIDSMVHDGLWDAFNNYHMGITAENLAEKYGITREAMDEFAAASQQKAAAAIKEGKFKSQIVPVEVPQRKGDPVVFDTDENPREVTADKLAGMRPAFKKDGTVTAGNASSLNDGAAVVMLCSAEKAKELGLKGFQKLRKDDMIALILEHSGNGASNGAKESDEEPKKKEKADSSDKPSRSKRRSRRRGDRRSARPRRHRPGSIFLIRVDR